VFGRLAGYEDVNDAERLSCDPAMRWIAGGRAAEGCAASVSEMGRFETEWLTHPENFTALADLSGHWLARPATGCLSQCSPVGQIKPPSWIFARYNASQTASVCYDLSPATAGLSALSRARY